MSTVSRVGVYVAGWTALMFVFSGQYILETLYAKRSVQFEPAMQGAALFAYTWAALAWPLFVFSRRQSGDTLTLRRVLPLLGAGALAVVIQIVVRFWAAQLLGWERERSLEELLVSHLYFNVAIALVIVTIEHVTRHRHQTEPATAASIEPVEYLDRLSVPENGRWLFVPVDEVEWFESAGNYVQLHLPDRVLMVRDRISGLENRLNPARFIRIHRRAIVNMAAISECVPATHGELTVVLRSGHRVTATRTYIARVRALLGKGRVAD